MPDALSRAAALARLVLILAAFAARTLHHIATQLRAFAEKWS